MGPRFNGVEDSLPAENVNQMYKCFNGATL